MAHTSVPQINLLSKKKAIFDEQAAIALRVKVISGVVLVVYLVLMTVVFGLQMVWNTQIESTQTTLSQTKLALSSQGSRVQQYEQSVAVLGKVQTLLKQRYETIDLWQKLQQVIPVGCELTAFALEKDTLRVSISAPHVVLANQAIEVVEKSLLEQLGAKAEESTISRGKDAQYMIDLEIMMQSPKGNKS